LEDYQSQSKLLLQELENKDREIQTLRDMQGSQNEDVRSSRKALLAVVIVIIIMTV